MAGDRKQFNVRLSPRGWALFEEARRLMAEEAGREPQGISQADVVHAALAALARRYRLLARRKNPENPGNPT